eukprot:7378855-Prymnesium_polylepis.1
MEPMDTDEGAVGISVADNPERNPVSTTERPADGGPAGAAGASAAFAGSSSLDVDETPADLGREGLRAATDAVRDDSAAYEDVQQPQVGVTAEVPEAPAEATKDLGKEALIARFRKMALGNSGG